MSDYHICIFKFKFNLIKIIYIRIKQIFAITKIIILNLTLGTICNKTKIMQLRHCQSQARMRKEEGVHRQQQDTTHLQLH